MEGYDTDPNSTYSYAQVTNSIQLKKEKKAIKFDNAVAFIHRYALNYGDTIPGENGNLQF
jgi:hypothetical protein